MSAAAASLHDPAPTIRPANRDGWLTDEQRLAVDHALTGLPLKVEAGAGTGKTTTLVAISKALVGTGRCRRGLYLAFNRAIAESAGAKLPPEVESRTAHGLAYRAVGHRFRHRLGRLTGTDLVASEHLTAAPGGLSVAALGNLALGIVNRFTHSAAPVIGLEHLPESELAPLPDDTARMAMSAAALEVAQHAWQRLADPHGTLPITHDVYLKLWALTEPQLPADLILFDEAQDANPVLLDLVQRQAAQVVWVGDRYQAIYGWRGAVNAMDRIRTPHTCALTQAFRFGPAIAELANAVIRRLLREPPFLRGNPARSSRITPAAVGPEAVLCRTNGRLVDVLLQQQVVGTAAALLGGTGELTALLRDARALKDWRRPATGPLAMFADWETVEAHAATEAGRDLQTLVKLLQRRDADTLLRATERAGRIPAAEADVVLATAHKAKGCEWGSVRLADDFFAPDERPYPREEANLLYVAVTRAMDWLDPGGVAGRLGDVSMG
jgi:hypothetical protein